MFVDRIFLKLVAGKGGNGVIAWRREKYLPKGGPTGGDGGKGGSIFIEADEGRPSLEAFRHLKMIQAVHGCAGGANQRIGKSGEDRILKVPCGTLIKDADTQEILCDLIEHGQRYLVCKGGKGGKGNEHFKSPTNRAPHICTPGIPGEEKNVEFELKLIADVGLVGYPNAGKSTLLSRLAHVEVKIGAYPFTTLHPNLGYLFFEDGVKILLADIPGIIEGAHYNKGLGFQFLRHIERTKILVYVLDSSGLENRSPEEDFIVLRRELELYNPALLEKPFVVVLNKMDLEDARVWAEAFLQSGIVGKKHVFCVSAQTSEGLGPLVESLRELAVNS